MTTPALPTPNSTAWYPWAQALDAAALRGGLFDDTGAPSSAKTRSSQWLDANTPLRSRLPVNLADRGAVGDGTTDDTTAISNAVAALPTTGGVLQMTPGATYLVSDRVNFLKLTNVRVIGNGATIHSTATAINKPVLRFDACTGVRVQDVTLQHTSGGARTNNSDGLQINNCADVVVSGVRVPFSLGIGIRIAGSRGVTVTGCRLVPLPGNATSSNADGIGIYQANRNGIADGSMTAGANTVISANVGFTQLDVGSLVRVAGAGAAGADLFTSITAVSGNTATLAATAATTVTAAIVYVARSSEHITVAGNHCDSTGDDSISVVGYQVLNLIPMTPNTDVAILGNTVKYGQSRGIIVGGGQRVAITGNTCDSPRNAGIHVAYDAAAPKCLGSSDVGIVNNIVNNANALNAPTAAYASISVFSLDTAYPVDGVRVQDNTVRGGSHAYIGIGSVGAPNLNGTTNVVVSGNQCLGGNGAVAGILVQRTNGIKVAGNHVDKAYTAGINISGDVTGYAPITDNIITAPNQSVTAGMAAIQLQAPNALLAGNRVIDDGTGKITVAITATGATGAQIYGNQIGSLTIAHPATETIFQGKLS